MIHDLYGKLGLSVQGTEGPRVSDHDGLCHQCSKSTEEFKFNQI